MHREKHSRRRESTKKNGLQEGLLRTDLCLAGLRRYHLLRRDEGAAQEDPR
jgi:hypothetical protein